MTLAAIPSPTTAVWELGPIPIRAYALCIIAGIVVASIVTEYRLRQRGVAPNTVLDIAFPAILGGIVGARLYHVITSPQGYFGEGGDPLRIFLIWEGGLGIWGAVAGGALGAWYACWRRGLPFVVVLDAAAVGLPLAQALGRLGNWFNNELYGRTTDLPWGLRVWEMDGGQALRVDGEPVNLPGLYHPTFLYEALWCIGLALLVWQVGKRLKLGHGRSFALYVAGYTAGRFWIELLRIDDANAILGLRVNAWVSVLLFLAALAYLLRARGPQEFVVPAEAGGTGSGGTGYRVVTEAEFTAHQQAEAAADQRGVDDTPPQRRESDGATSAAGEPGSTGSRD